jgi:hypothetical protein
MLSLEAPLVAVFWQSSLARAHGLHLLPSMIYGLGLVTWLIYLLDRVLDCGDAELRHEFYRRHRALIAMLVLPVLAVAVGWLALWHLPEEVLWQAVGVLVITVLYFLVFVLRIAPPLLPKTHAAGLIFAVGCTSSIRFLDMPETQTGPLLECLVLAFLIISNLTALVAREEESDPAQPRRWRVLHPALLGCHILIVAVVLLMVNLGALESVLAVPVTAVLVGLALLAVLHRFRQSFSLESHRALADLAVIAPLPLLWL